MLFEPTARGDVVRAPDLIRLAPLLGILQNSKPLMIVGYCPLFDLVN